MVVAATLSTSATAEKISASEAIEKIESRDEATVSFVFGIYTGIYPANESLTSSNKPSLYCPPTIFVADGPNVIDILDGGSYFTTRQALDFACISPRNGPDCSHVK